MRVLITGSADGLGRMAAQRLTGDGHEVVLHARNRLRARDAKEAVSGSHDVVIGDLSSISEMRDVAEQANGLGRFDAIIHNAAVGYREPRIETIDGLEHVFAINMLAPYVLTALMTRPSRLIYLSSGMHRSGSADVSDLQWRKRPWDGSQAYADSKLYDVALAFAVARHWPAVRSNAVEPGWVPTKMGGSSAPDDLKLGDETQAWLAVSDDPAAAVSGKLFFHRKLRESHPAASDATLQDALLRLCSEVSGVSFPGRG